MQVQGSRFKGTPRAQLRRPRCPTCWEGVLPLFVYGEMSPTCKAGDIFITSTHMYLRSGLAHPFQTSETQNDLHLKTKIIPGESNCGFRRILVKASWHRHRRGGAPAAE